MKFNGYSKEYLQEKAHEYRQKGLSLFKIKEKFAEELGVEISHTTIANRLKKKIDTQLEQLNEINKQIEYERPFEFEDDNIVFYTSKRNKYGDKVLEKIAIPIDIVKQIRADYSKHGGNLSQQQILVKYNLNPHAWHVMKNRLGLYKDSDIVPDWLLEKIEKEKGEEGVNEKIEEISYEAVHNKYRNVLVKRYERVKNKEYEKAITKLYDIENFLMMLREFIDNYEPKEIDFDIDINNQNNDTVYIAISDIHFGKEGHDEVVERFKKVINKIKNMPENNIKLFILGDIAENLVIGGMHVGQIEKMDGPHGFELIMEIVNIIEQGLIEIAKQGKKVEMIGITGNHCFRKDEHPEFLTEEGFKEYDEIVEKNLKVAQIGKDGQIEFVYPTGYINEKRLGIFCEYINTTGKKLKKMTVTDGHKFIINGKKIKAKDLDYFKLTDTPKPIGKYKIDKVDILAMLTIFDGTVVMANDHNKEYFKKKYGDKYIEYYNKTKKFKRLQFKVSKPRKIKYLREMFKRLGIKYTESIQKKLEGHQKLTPHIFRIHGDIARKVYELIGPNKKVPLKWYNMDEESKAIFKEIIRNTDGVFGNQHIKVSQVKKDIIDLINTLFYTYEYIRRNPSGFKNGKPQYIINENYGNTQFKKNKTYIDIAEVVDFEMPNGNLFVKVNGYVINHSNCRLNKKDNMDYMGGLIIYEMIKRGLQNINQIIVNYYIEVWNTREDDNFAFILQHGHLGGIKKKTADILWKYGRQGKHNIILQGHIHSLLVDDVDGDATRIIVPALAGDGHYNKSLGLKSYPGFVIIKLNEDGYPDTTVIRLK